MSPEEKSAGLGVLVVVLGWIGWSLLHAGDTSAGGLPGAPMAGVSTGAARPPGVTPLATAAPAVAAPSTLSPPPPPLPAPAAAPTLKDGFVLEHGQVTAVRASVDLNQPAAADLPIVELPPGVSAEDVVVAPNGVVTVTRSPPPAPGVASDDEAADTLRPPALTRSP